MTMTGTMTRSLSPTRRSKLEELLQREKAKTRDSRIDASRAAASTATMFRDMQLDTHPKAPTEDFGPSRKVQSALATKKAMNATKAAARQAAAAQAAAAAAASRKHGGLTAEEKQKLMGSVFGSTGEQRYIAGLANKHRELMQQSEWALLDTLYVQMANEEEVMRARLKANSQAEVRGMLARQLEERAAVSAAAKEVKEREHEAMLDRMRAEEEAAAEKVAQNKAAKAVERQALIKQFNEARSARDRAKEARRLEEDMLLKQMSAALEAERQVAAAKKAAALEEMSKTMQENEIRMELKAEAKRRQKEADEVLMQQTLAALEEQERRREEATKRFHDMIAARAAKAGTMAVAAAQQKTEREELLMRQFQEQKEAEAAAKERAKAEAKAKAKADMLASQKAYEEEKARKEAEARETAARQRLELDIKVELLAEVEREKAAAARAKQAELRAILDMQTKELEARKVSDDVGMSPRERAINQRLLQQATRVLETTTGAAYQ